MPTNRVVLWGHHFTAVAGAAPIIGPSIAVVWGWLPAFLWVVIGTMFFAGVHDFGAIWASVRNKALSVGSLTGEVVSHRARNLFMIVVFFLLLMVNAVFAVAISNEFINTPASVIPAWTAVFVAVGIGILLYRVGVGITWPTVAGTVILYAVIYLGELVPVTLTETAGVAPAAQWILILFAYAAVASMLPVWLLLQPRDYINGIQLFVGLGILYGAVFIASPTIVAPPINPNVPPGTPPIMPLLFVTIACGAISGFHGLVSSGTTSKQLNKETDARFVGYLGSLGEGTLAIVAIIAVTAGFAMTDGGLQPARDAWQSAYSNAESFGAVGGISAFVAGGAQIASQGLGLPLGFAETLLAVMAVLFAGTTMDAGVPAAALHRAGVGDDLQHPAAPERLRRHRRRGRGLPRAGVRRGGADGTGGMIIWPLFGTTNQLLAGLTLLSSASCWSSSDGRRATRSSPWSSSPRWRSWPRSISSAASTPRAATC